MCEREKKRERGRDLKCDKPDQLLLAMEMEEGSQDPRNKVDIRSWEGQQGQEEFRPTDTGVSFCQNLNEQKTDSPLQTPERNIALLTP